MAPHCLDGVLGDCRGNCRTRVQHLQLTRRNGHVTAAHYRYCGGRGYRPRDRPLRELGEFRRRALIGDNLFGPVSLLVRIAVAIRLREKTRFTYCTFLCMERVSRSMRCMVRGGDTFPWTFLKLTIVNGEQKAEPELPITGFRNRCSLTATGLAQSFRSQKRLICFVESRVPDSTTYIAANVTAGSSTLTRKGSADGNHSRDRRSRTN